MAQIELRAVPPFLLPADALAPDTGARDAVLRDAEAMLDHSELRRAHAMEPAVRTQFLVSRLAQRRFAAALVSLPPSGLAVDYSCPHCGTGTELSHGRPGYAYRGGRLPLALSLSRADGWTLLAAVADAGPDLRLGVDIEDAAGAGFAGFAELALTDAEQRATRELEGDALLAARARLWARKEAWLKMTGDGLRTAPSSLDVRHRPGLADLPPADTGLPTHLAAAVALS